jgi:Na+/H+-dicarboxylate symporter
MPASSEQPTPASSPSKAQDAMPQLDHRRLTRAILGALLLGVLVGLLLQWSGWPVALREAWLMPFFQWVGQAFMRLLRMLVVPVVFLSLTVGASRMDSIAGMGRLGLKSFALYLVTTACAITLALCVAHLFSLGQGMGLHAPSGSALQTDAAPHWSQVLLQAIPMNPFLALTQGKMLQVIVFALFLGSALTAVRPHAAWVEQAFVQFNTVLMHMIGRVMWVAPIGVFCLIAHVMARMGWSVLWHMLAYVLTVLLVLLLQASVLYSALLVFLARRNPWHVLKQMRTALLFAFGVSSSNASIPLVLESVEQRLGVPKRIASFVIPLGATINMDGTAIMQGVATVLIAHAYGISLSLSAYLTVIGMATVASIGTAGVPGVGLITLAMVLEQVHLPVAGIAMILGVDRVLDMARTAVNVAGDATVACVVARSERRREG